MGRGPQYTPQEDAYIRATILDGFDRGVQLAHTCKQLANELNRVPGSIEQRWHKVLRESDDERVKSPVRRKYATYHARLLLHVKARIQATADVMGMDMTTLLERAMAAYADKLDDATMTIVERRYDEIMEAMSE